MRGHIQAKYRGTEMKGTKNHTRRQESNKTMFINKNKEIGVVSIKHSRQDGRGGNGMGDWAG